MLEFCYQDFDEDQQKRHERCELNEKGFGSA